jgi:hypothetical protein
VADTKRSVALQRLEVGLRDPALRATNFVEWTPFVPVTTPASSSEPTSMNVH